MKKSLAALMIQEVVNRMIKKGRKPIKGLPAVHP